MSSFFYYYRTNGTVSLTIIYVALVVSCCFVPSLLIKKLKSKYTMALSMLAYSTYIAAQFYPSLATLAPSGILVGLAAAPLWSAKCTYLTKVRRISYGNISCLSLVMMIRRDVTHSTSRR